VPAAADGPSRRTYKGEDGAGENGDDAKRPNDGDLGDEADDQQHHSEDDHVTTP
jgi:hypothetical protein